MDSEEGSGTGEHMKLSVEEIIEKYVGGFGGAQLFQVLVVALGWGFDIQNTFLPIFTDAQPSWRCTSPHFLQITCTKQSSICDMDPQLWEWNTPKKASIISEWDLICANNFKAGIPQFFFFTGALLGCIMLGPLADSSLGRKRMLLLSSLTLSLTGFLTSLSPNIWIYSLLRAFSGFGKAPIGTCCLVLSTEIVGRKWRSLIGFLLFFTCTLGFVSLPILAYLTRLNFSWRRTYIYLSIPPLAYSLFLLPFVWESPRWLLLRRGNSDEALQSFKKMAEWNGRLLPENIIIEERSITENQTDSALSRLWTTKWARIRLMLTMAVGFGMGLIYYGMPFGVGSLHFNLYLSVTFNALSEIPAAIISTLLVAKAPRRKSILLLTILSGMLCFVCVVYSMDTHKSTNWGQMGAELGAFLSAVTAYNVLLIYCLELFPSSVRNSAMSMVKQAVNVGAIASPVIVVIITHGAPYLSFAIFGIAIIMSGLFVMGLPETKDRPFCDTLEGQQWQEKEHQTPLLS
ncbi:hypothetical protein KI387_031984 [Taxus chinensis]|uniref:Major facilitator superfamily (MFS) profile domain-containing protein n=1 Tax=Taxus chinensis TaxID=29808 RepID=A0AA38BQV4_TAXCH|nr:hypothetical protein KI387_031984 [Taxus chinensis]